MGSSTKQGLLWGAKADDWANLAEPTTAPLWEALLDGCGVGPGTALLDLGCGGGGLCMRAAARGAIVSGLDASEALIRIAQHRAPLGNFRQGDLEDVPFSDAEFDAVTAANSIQFADDRAQAIREAKRVLKPDGRFGIGMWCEPDRCEMAAVFKSQVTLAPPPPPDNPPAPSLSDRANLIELVEGGGFSILKEGEVECVFHFSSEAVAIQALSSAGMSVAVQHAMGEERLIAALKEGIRPFIRQDGSVQMSNWFRYLVAR